MAEPFQLKARMDRGFDEIPPELIDDAEKPRPQSEAWIREDGITREREKSIE